MYEATDFQVQYNDHQRQMAWVNNEGWRFDPPQVRRRMRERVAQALVAFAARLAPAMEQPRTA